MLETLMEIDNVRLNYSEQGSKIVSVTIALIMFGVALELKPRDFRRLLNQPKSALVGIFSQFLLMPLLTFLLVLSLSNYITPTVGLGMILVAACPGGNISNFISSLARGNVALSVSLTAFSSIGGLLLTPLNFAFWGNLYLKYHIGSSNPSYVPPINIDIFSVFITIVFIIGIPLFLGILFNTKFPKTTQRIVVTVKRLSIIAFTAIVIAIFSANFDHFIKFIKYIFLLVLVHNALALFMGYYVAKAFKLNKTNRKTISIETGIQNSGLALALLFNPAIFPVDLPIGGMAFIAAWWGVWHILSGLTIASIWSGFSIVPKSYVEV
jgi:BASS family bile acid:Na+ symporter